MAEDHVHHIPCLTGCLSFPQPPAGAPAYVAERIREYRTEVPDTEVTIHQLVADGDTVPAQ